MEPKWWAITTMTHKGTPKFKTTGIWKHDIQQMGQRAAGLESVQQLSHLFHLQERRVELNVYIRNILYLVYYSTVQQIDSI